MSSPYTPTTAEIRGHYSWKSSSIVGALEYSEGLSEFERWLAAHDAEVAAKAIEDAGAQYSEYEAFIASDGHMSLRRHDKSVDEWLRDRAAEYRKTETEGK